MPTKKFVIEQVALCPASTDEAMELLRDMGLAEWTEDTVTAEGRVQNDWGVKNVANLRFNYDSAPRELEVLEYTSGRNWMDAHVARVSHIGMHCSAAELDDWRGFFAERGYKVVQEVNTTGHTNPAIAGKRSYKYCIFDTYRTLGVDVKLIVRIE